MSPPVLLAPALGAQLSLSETQLPLLQNRMEMTAYRAACVQAAREDVWQLLHTETLVSVFSLRPRTQRNNCLTVPSFTAASWQVLEGWVLVTLRGVSLAPATADGNFTSS